MQNITERQIKQIAKEISQEHEKIKYSKVLEVISHSLGYKNYNTLSAKFKEEGNKKIFIERPILDFVSTKLEDTTHSHEKTKKKEIVLVGKVCPNCNGNKGWEIGIIASANNFMWIDDGEYMDIGYKKCFWCSGTGRATNKRIKEMKKIKRENEKFSC
jgi:hypothetical protein